MYTALGVGAVTAVAAFMWFGPLGAVIGLLLGFFIGLFVGNMKLV